MGYCLRIFSDEKTPFSSSQYADGILRGENINFSYAHEPGKNSYLGWYSWGRICLCDENYNPQKDIYVDAKQITKIEELANQSDKIL